MYKVHVQRAHQVEKRPPQQHLELENPRCRPVVLEPLRPSLAFRPCPVHAPGLALRSHKSPFRIDIVADRLCRRSLSPSSDELLHPSSTFVRPLKVLRDGDEVVRGVRPLRHSIPQTLEPGDGVPWEPVEVHAAPSEEDDPVETAEDVPRRLVDRHEAGDVASPDDLGDVGDEEIGGEGVEAGCGLVEEQEGDIADEFLR